uniref:Transcription initiation factor tfiid subunit 3 n=1 Tax=Triatoma infestans TaxID=30076 RepID=A0A170UQJ2_TRIIF
MEAYRITSSRSQGMLRGIG